MRSASCPSTPPREARFMSSAFREVDRKWQGERVKRWDRSLAPSHLRTFSLSCLILLACAPALAGERPILQIAADPNNLPFSNDREEGFENKIAQIIASELGAKIEYTWWAQRRGFYRDTL